jgi:hypothetical protein
MRQLVCMSAHVYCQITNNFSCATTSFYTRMERRGKGLAPGETERERVCEGQRVAENGVGVHCKMAVGRRINYFGISREPDVKITFS